MKRRLALLSSGLRRLASPQPGNAKVRWIRNALPTHASAQWAGRAPTRVALQSVEDPFYFALFASIVAEARQIRSVETELVIVRAISGAIGVGWRARLLRSVPVTWVLSTQWVRAYAGLVERVAYRSRSWSHPVHDLGDWLRSFAIWWRMRDQPGNFGLVIRGVDVGDLVSDTYLRFRPSPRFDVNDTFVIRLIWQAHCAVRRAQRYFQHAAPRLYLTSYTTYIEHGVPARVALHAGIKVHSFGSLARFDKALSLADGYHTPDCAHYRTTFESLDGQPQRLAQAEERLQARLAGGVDLATSYMKVSAYAASNEALPSDVAGTVVVFLHDFYDSPHVYADFIFVDFWAWACFTIETLARAGTPFFLKPHPNQVELSSDALDRLVAAHPQARLLPAGITNSQLVNAGMACGITVYGTVAHELAYLGIPSIGCARHPHIAFDFCVTATTVEAYETHLRAATDMAFDPAAMRKQALAFYYMHNLHGTSEELDLRSRFNALWKTCQDPDASSQEVVASLEGLRQAPWFRQRLQEILEGADARA